MASKQDEDDSKSPDQKESKNESPSKPKGKGPSPVDLLTQLFKKSSLDAGDEEEPTPEQVLESVTFDGIVEYIRQGKANNIVVMAGAGISTSAGIPDFRSPGSGLYDNLAKYDLPDPTAIFELGFFKKKPEPFFQLAKELWPGVFKPTPCHYFIRLLHEKGLLCRHFTQNIDTLERVAGIEGDKIVEAHGTFHTAHCLQCRKEYSQQWVKEHVFQDNVPRCPVKDCEGLVKPDIVFFGEALPERFFKCASEDLKKCDLLIVLGTSLVVQPFASLVNRVSETCPRLYINLEKSAGGDPIMALLGYGHGFKFDEEDNYRDVFKQSTCDDGCTELATKLGWGEELKNLVETEHKRIDTETKDSGQKKPATSTSTSETDNKL